MIKFRNLFFCFSPTNLILHLILFISISFFTFFQELLGGNLSYCMFLTCPYHRKSFFNNALHRNLLLVSNSCFSSVQTFLLTGNIFRAACQLNYLNQFLTKLQFLQFKLQFSPAKQLSYYYISYIDLGVAAERYDMHEINTLIIARL